MWNRQWIFLAGLVACGGVAIQLASRLPAQQDDTAHKPATDSGHEKEKQQLELDLSYAKAYLRLVEAIQVKFEEANRRQPNTVSPSVIQVIQEGVGEARDRVQLLEKGDLSDAEISVAIAETELRSAQESLSKAEQANGVTAGSVSAAQLGIFKADVELGKTRVARARHLSSESALASARFELGQLREEIYRLQLRVTLLRENN